MKFNQYVNAFIAYLLYIAITVSAFFIVIGGITMVFANEEIGIEPLERWNAPEYFAMFFLLVVFIAFVILAIKVIYVPVLVIDNEENLISAIKESWRITKGNFWKLTGTVTMFVMAHIATCALVVVGAMCWGFKIYSNLLGIGLLYITPVATLTLLLFYRNNLNQEKE